ncbi:hypothetical protein AAZX31_11G240300 [Glycine max]
MCFKSYTWRYVLRNRLACWKLRGGEMCFYSCFYDVFLLRH